MSSISGPRTAGFVYPEVIVRGRLLRAVANHLSSASTSISEIDRLKSVPL